MRFEYVEIKSKMTKQNSNLEKRKISYSWAFDVEFINHFSPSPLSFAPLLANQLVIQVTDSFSSDLHYGVKIFV